MASSFTDRWRPNESGLKNSGSQQLKNVMNGNQRLSKGISSFYVTNFPDYVVRSDLWRMCNRFGKVVDVFISSKKSRFGKRFGFIRFVEVSDSELMIKNLRQIWFGYYKLFASFPRISNPSNLKIKGGNSRVHVEKHAGSLLSYASVVKGIGDNTILQNKDESIQISAGDFIVEKRKRACLIKGRDFLTLPNLRMLCFDEGFEDFDIRYVGGLWVMLEFKHKESCKNFLQSDAMNHWIVEKRP